jgi:hypothetical protein
MGRSVSYLSRAQRVAYFEWPKVEVYDEKTEEFSESDTLEDYDIVVEDIQETIKSEFPEFDNAKKSDDRETLIILEGYGTQIGLSEYCGLASLSIRVDSFFEDEEDQEKILEWIEENWEKVSNPWNKLQKLGTFSNGEGIYQNV